MVLNPSSVTTAGGTVSSPIEACDYDSRARMTDGKVVLFRNTVREYLEGLSTPALDFCHVLNDFSLFQLYEIDDNPKRKEFLDELFRFMHNRGKLSATIPTPSQAYIRRRTSCGSWRVSVL